MDGRQVRIPENLIDRAIGLIGELNEHGDSSYQDLLNVNARSGQLAFGDIIRLAVVKGLYQFGVEIDEQIERNERKEQKKTA